MEKAHQRHQAANEARAQQGRTAARVRQNTVPVEPAVLVALIAGLKELLGALRRGAWLTERDGGSLRLGDRERRRSRSVAHSTTNDTALHPHR